MSDFHITLPVFIAGWLIIVSLITVVVTVYDKIAAKKNPRHRVPENTLIYLGVLGGAVAEYIVMKLIRHKTRHKKFMVGLPVIIVLQAGIAVAVWFIMK